MTCEEATRRHPGFDANYFRRLCLHGQWLRSKYSTHESIPVAEQCRALFGKKVGKYWMIPVEELDRYFLPVNSEARNQPYRRRLTSYINRSPVISTGNDTRKRDEAGRFCNDEAWTWCLLQIWLLRVFPCQRQPVIGGYARKQAKTTFKRRIETIRPVPISRVPAFQTGNCWRFLI